MEVAGLLGLSGVQAVVRGFCEDASQCLGIRGVTWSFFCLAAHREVPLWLRFQTTLTPGVPLPIHTLQYARRHWLGAFRHFLKRPREEVTGQVSGLVGGAVLWAGICRLHLRIAHPCPFADYLRCWLSPSSLQPGTCSPSTPLHAVAPVFNIL